MQRGEIWWTYLPDAVGSAPGYRRPVLIIQSDIFTGSRIRTVVVAAISSNLNLADAPGNVLLHAKDTGLPKDSVVNVSQIATVDKQELDVYIGTVATHVLDLVDSGLRLVLDL